MGVEKILQKMQKKSCLHTCTQTNPRRLGWFKNDLHNNNSNVMFNLKLALFTMYRNIILKIAIIAEKL